MNDTGGGLSFKISFLRAMASTLSQLDLQTFQRACVIVGVEDSPSFEEYSKAVLDIDILYHKFDRPGGG